MSTLEPLFASAIEPIPASPWRDAEFRRFIDALESNSEFARRSWLEYRDGHADIRRRFAGPVNPRLVDAKLASDLVFMAIHSEQDVAVVRDSLREALSASLGVVLFLNAAMELAGWARRHSKEDVPLAMRMVDFGESHLDGLETLERENMKALIRYVRGSGRPA